MTTIAHEYDPSISAYVISLQGKPVRNDEGARLTVKELNNGWQVRFFSHQNIWSGHRFLTEAQAFDYAEQLAWAYKTI